MITFEQCKGYDIITVSKRKAMKENFLESLSAMVNPDGVKEQVLTVLNNGGRVYGLKKKKELVALTVFKKEEIDRYEFEELAKQDEELGMSFDKLPKNLKKVAILKFLAEYGVDGHDQAMEWFRKTVKMELKEFIIWGSYHVIYMNDEIISQNDVVNENSDYNGSGLAIGISIGLLFGILYDNIAMGLSLGLLFGVAFGGVFSIKKKTSTDNTEDATSEEVK